MLYVPPFAYLGCLRSLLCAALSDLSPLQQITKHQYTIAMHNYVGNKMNCFIYDISLYILEQYQIVCRCVELIVTISNNNCDRIRIMYGFIMRKTLVFIYIILQIQEIFFSFLLTICNRASQNWCSFSLSLTFRLQIFIGAH